MGARLCCRARLRFIWMVRFLRTKYQNVEIVFITHHSEPCVTKRIDTKFLAIV